MDNAPAVITLVVQFMLGSIKKHLGIVVSSSDHIRGMHAKVKELERSADVMRTTLKENKAKNLVVPENSVQEWLAEVEKIKEREDSIPTGVGCFNIKKRYKAGKQSLDIVKDIGSLMKEKEGIRWSNEIKPLAIVSPPRPTTSATVHDANQNQDVFESRVLIFNAALNSLNPKTSETQMLALCGMGGVGKTKMMDQLKKAVKEKQMYDYVVKVVVGQKPDPIVLQRAIAEYTDGKDLPVQTKGARAELLQKKFEEMSENGKKNILVMLDDVWEWLDLKEIGLISPLPNSTKLLFSSRDENVCTQMGVRRSSIFTVAILEKSEAKNLFFEEVGLGSDSSIELDLHQIGEDIVKRCGGLPLAITTIAAALREKEHDEWKDVLSRLKKSDDLKIKAIFEISYENLKTDDLKAIFLLCGLFPEDYNIAKEDILRYGWGLKFFSNVHTLAEARRRVNTCANILMRSNLLLKGYNEGCVKIHDLVRDFVLSTLSNVRQASIVSHNDSVSDELKERESYERILVKCGDMSEFPIDFNLPNLTLLILMGGYKQLKFPEVFYARMGKLKVVAYNNISRPLLPQYLTNLRTLSFQSCYPMDDDISFLGDLINLEVLVLAHCGIRMLPSKIGNLKKLKLLDLDGCKGLCIDDNVFQNLGKLEELYMNDSGHEGIRFTDANMEELKNLSRKLSALEFAFFKNEAQPKDVSFEKLERFRISVDCSLSYRSSLDSFKNTLQLVTRSSELVECKINELFCKTEVLYLEMNDLNNLEDISTHSPQHSFRNLKFLCVSGSVHLTCLFTIPVAKQLRKLEKLVIKSCPVLKEIWSYEIASSEEEFLNFPMLREIVVEDCNSIVNLFPSNPMQLLSCLEKLKVERCGSIEVLFNIDLDKFEQLSSKSSLKSIDVRNLVKLGAVWRIENAKKNHTSLLINCFESVESITILGCKKFRNIVTPTTSNFNMRAIRDIIIQCIDYEKSSQEQEVGTMSNEEISSEVGGVMSIDALSSYETTLNFHNLRKVTFRGFQGVDVVFVFEIESPSNTDQVIATRQQQPLLPYLEDLELRCMNKLSHVWKCNNWNEFFILHKHQPQSSSFQNLATITLYDCNNIKYLFPSRMVKLLFNLKKVEIGHCKGMEEVVSNRDEEEVDEMETSTSIDKTTTTLDMLQLSFLNNLHHINDYKLFSQVGNVSWSLCQYSREIYISNCHALSSVIPYYAAGQMEKLQVLEIYSCTGMKEVFETKEIINDPRSITTHSSLTIPVPKNITMHKFPNLKELEITGCDCLKNIFMFSTLESLKKLETLTIRRCMAMEVIVREECGDQATTSSRDVVEFPHLKTIVLAGLPNLAGFFLGMNTDFHWPLLDHVEISDCPQMRVFASGQSTTPRLEYMHTKLGQHDLECGLNFHLTPTSHQKPTSSLGGVSSHPTPSDGRLWSFHNLIECKLFGFDHEKKIFPSNELEQLQKLETIHARDCNETEEVFEVVTNNDSQTVVTFPKLREVELKLMRNLKSIWKSNQWRKLEFPNLTRLSLYKCDSLEYVFTCSMVGSVMQLQQLYIQECENMKVIVKEEDDDEKVSEIVVFPCLKSLNLERLSRLEGFSLGKEDFTFPTLHTFEIYSCPKIKVFTHGCSVTPELRTLKTNFNFVSLNCNGEDLNSFIRTKIEEGFRF